MLNFQVEPDSDISVLRRCPCGDPTCIVEAQTGQQMASKNGIEAYAPYKQGQLFVLGKKITIFVFLSIQPFHSFHSFFPGHGRKCEFNLLRYGHDEDFDTIENMLAEVITPVGAKHVPTPAQLYHQIPHPMSQLMTSQG